MKSLPIHKYTIRFRKKTKAELEGKEAGNLKNPKTWTIKTMSALPPLENPRIIKRIRIESNSELDELVFLIVNKEEVIGITNKIY